MNRYVSAVARSVDLEEVSRLVNSAYRGDSSRRGWTTEADFLGGQRTDAETLAKEIAAKNGVVLCLREEGKPEIVGTVFLAPFDDERGPVAYLGMLTVNPTLQAGGIGRILLEHAEKFVRGWGVKRMNLGVIHLRESLMAWYERRGYVRNGKTERFPYGDPKAGIPTRDDLYFIMFDKELGP